MSTLSRSALLLQAVVDISFRLLTGPDEALRPAGVRALREAVRTYASLEDPLMPGKEGSKSMDKSMDKSMKCVCGAGGV